MPKDPRLSKLPTPQYVIEAWKAMHEHMSEATMGAWEAACQRARNEAAAWLRDNPNTNPDFWNP